jgi:hypothetical protein
MWWWSSVAHAGACCVGAGAGLPLRAGEYEHVVLGFGAAGEGAALRWDDAGAVKGAAPTEVALQATAAITARWASWGQATVSLPARVTHRAAPGAVDDGAGLGDLRAAVVLDPFVDRRGGPPVPVFTLGLRAPTGRDWTEASGPLLADVTGLPGVGGTAMVTFEHVSGEGPWWVGLDVIGDPDTPTRAGGSAAWGRYVGARATWLATARHERQLAAGGAARTTLGGRVVWGRPMRGRIWLGLATDVPIPGLGSGLPATTSLDLGAALIR